MSLKKQLEKYTEIAWRKLPLEKKLKALQAIGATGSNQMMKKLKNDNNFQGALVEIVREQVREFLKENHDNKTK